MAVFEKFCGFFSVRLGTIIVAIFAGIQSTILLILSFNGFDHYDIVSDYFTEWFHKIEFDGDFYREIAEDPNNFLIVLIIFFICLSLSSILLLFGAVKCNTNLAYPFLVFYFLYLILLIIGCIVAMLLVRASNSGLGTLILYANLILFVLLFYLYTWACVLSFTQIVNELRRRLNRKLKVVETMKVSEKIRQKPPVAKMYPTFSYVK